MVMFISRYLFITRENCFKIKNFKRPKESGHFEQITSGNQDHTITALETVIITINISRKNIHLSCKTE